MDVELQLISGAADDVYAAVTDVHPKVPARLVEFRQGRHIALAPHTTYALIENPEFIGVPGAAAYAYGLLTWRGTRLPLIDLGAALSGESARGAPRYGLIVAYQPAARAPLAYGALALAELPRTIAVGDADQCGLPADSHLWSRLAVSCIQYEGQPVPIVDPACIFSSYLG